MAIKCCILIIELKFNFREEGFNLAQVLKDEIFDRIFHAGVEVFYEKDFRTAKMKEIAERAEIPVGLIYSYYKNKEELFIKIVSSLPVNFEKLIEEEENSDGLPSERYKKLRKNICLTC